MSIISECKYDLNGELIEPGRLELNRALCKLDLESGERPTFDAGYTHVFTFRVTGKTPDHAYELMDNILRRFEAHVGFVGGYQELSHKRTQGITAIHRDYQISHTIVYAIESGRRRALRPESPHVGSQRGRSNSVTYRR